MTRAAPPGIPDDPLTKFFWDGAREGQLRILRCQDCGTYIHLPRPICRACRSFNLAGEAVSGTAKLYSFSITHKPFHPYFVDRVPYAVATVALVEQEGLHFLSNLVDVEVDDIEIGMDLQVRFDALSDDVVIPVFTAAGGS
jgi:uncharacterized OB-fold protein